MSLPQINLWSVDTTNIFLNWSATNRSTIVTYNLYGSATVNGSYTLKQGYITNSPASLTPGSVLVTVSRASLSIGATDGYFFKITSVDTSNAESSLSASPLYAVEPLVSGGSTNLLVDVHNVTLYPSNEVTVTGTSTKFLSVNGKRRYLMIINKGTVTVYVKPDVAHSGTEGIAIPAGGSWEPPFVPINAFFFKAASGSQTVEIIEGA